MTKQHTCKGCEQSFTPTRKNQDYCNRRCQKNASRGSRQRENSQMTAIHYQRAHDLFHMVYGVAPNQRLGAMKNILDTIPQDACLRRILSDPLLLNEAPRAYGRKNFVQAASGYTKKFFGVSISTYVKQVKAGTVNEEFEQPRTSRTEPVSNDPEVFVQRAPVLFFAELKKLRDEARSFSRAA